MHEILKRIKQINLQSSKGYYISFLMLYILVFFVAFFWYFYYGKSAVWSSDGLSQHLTAALYTSEYYRDVFKSIFSGDCNIKMWDSTIGFGSDVLNVATFRPLTWMSALFDAEHMDVYIFLCVFIRLLLAGLSISAYLIHIKCDYFPVLLSSILYSFSSYAMFFSTRQYTYVNMMIFLPIMLLGIEKILAKKEPGWFILGVWGGAISSYYYLYIISIFAGLYALVRCLYIAYSKRVNPLKNLFKLLGYYILGISISMYALMPYIYSALESGRIGGGENAEIAISLTNYMKYYYVQLIENIVGVEQVGLGFVGGFSALMLFAVAMLIVYKLPGKKVILSVLLFLLGCACIPFMSVVFNAFSGYTIRWCFVITLALATLMAFCMTKVKRISEEKLKKILLILLGYIGVFLITQIWFGLDGGHYILPLLGLIVVLLWMNRHNGLSLKKNNVRFVLLMFVVGEVATHAYFLCNHKYVNYLNLYHDQNYVVDEVSDLPVDSISQIKDDSLFRVDEIDSQYMKSVYNRNYGIRTGLNGVSTYYSLTSGETVSYVYDMGVVQQPAPFSILNLSYRTILNTLNNVKYIAAEKNNESLVPYGYKLVRNVTNQSGDEILIYENEHFLPYIYTYNKYISREDFETFTTVQKEEALLQGAVIEEELDGYEKAQPFFSDVEVLTCEQVIEQLKSQAVEIDDVEKKIIIKKANTTVRLVFDGYTNVENYLCVDDFEFTPIAKENYFETYIADNTSMYNKALFELENDLWNPIASSKVIINNKQGVYLNSNLSQYYTGAENAVVNLGYSDTAKTAITIKFEQVGEYDFSNIRVVCRSMDNYETCISELIENAADEIEYTTNKVSAVIESDAATIACINIPYSTGWRAIVNGKEKQPFLANGMYMGLEIEAGKNEIVLVYETPGLKLGFQISLIVIAILIVVLGLRKFMRGNLEWIYSLKRRLRK